MVRTDFDHPPVGSHIHEIGPLKGGQNDVNERLVFDFYGARGGEGAQKRLARGVGFVY